MDVGYGSRKSQYLRLTLNTISSMPLVASDPDMLTLTWDVITKGSPGELAINKCVKPSDKRTLQRGMSSGNIFPIQDITRRRTTGLFKSCYPHPPPPLNVSCSGHISDTHFRKYKEIGSYSICPTYNLVLEIILCQGDIGWARQSERDGFVKYVFKCR